jgi:hypothetical protein
MLTLQRYRLRIGSVSRLHVTTVRFLGGSAQYIDAVIAQELLDELWDFEDPAGPGRRFAAAEELPSHTESERAELATQRARALGLQGRFDHGHAVLESLGHTSDADKVVATPIALETGRLLNSAGRPAEAIPQFEVAVSTAGSGGLLFLHIDALHMLAIADEGWSDEWAAKAMGLTLTATDDRTRRWGSSPCTTTSAARTLRPGTSRPPTPRSCRQRNGPSASAPTSSRSGRARRSRSARPR